MLWSSYEDQIDLDTGIRGFAVSIVTISPKFQVVIPLGIRESLKLRPGQKVHAMELDGRIELIPVKSAHELRGFLKGIDTRMPRDPDRV